MISSPAALERALSELAYAAERTLFFRQHVASAGLRVSDIRRSEDFARIPTTEKKDFRKWFPSGVLATGFAVNDPRLYRSESSGTAGERLTTLELPVVYAARMLTCASVHPALRAALVAQPKRHVRLAAPNCSTAVCADAAGGTMEERILADGTLVLAVRHDLMTTPEDAWIANLIEIEQYRPQLYYADPMHLAELARYARRRGFRPFPAPAALTYSLVTHLSRRHIVEAFGSACPLVGVASMSELGWLAVECPYGALHANNASYYLELRCRGRAAIPEEPAELIVTTLDHGCTPRIRYRTRDVFSLVGRACRCGHPFPGVRMEGRLAECVFIDGELALTPRGLDDLIGEPGWLDLYKLHQTDDRRFLLQLVVNGRYAEAAEAPLVGRLRGRLGPEAWLDVEKVRYIAGEYSGKLAVCSSEVGDRFVEEGLTL